MFVKHRIFGYYIILSLLFSSNKVMGDIDLSLLMTDNTSIDQDSCYSIINEQPCVKSVLKALLGLVNDNMRETRELKSQISDNSNEIREFKNQMKLFEDRYQNTKEKLNLLQNEVADKEQKIEYLENSLQNIFVENARLKLDAQKTKSEDYFDTSSTTSSLSNYSVKRSNVSDWFINNELNEEFDKWSTVRQ